MSDPDLSNEAPATWLDKQTGVIYTWNILTGRWDNSSAVDGKPRLLAIDSVTPEDLTPATLALLAGRTMFTPLTTTVADEPQLTWDDDDQLILTEVDV